MSTKVTSRETPPTLQYVLDFTATAPNVSPKKRTEMKSAVRTVARALNLPPESIPADARLLAARVAEISPQIIGLSTGRWANVQSLLRAALAQVSDVTPRRHTNSLLPEWKELWDAVGGRSEKTCISRFLHFCSEQGITPTQLSAECFQTFRAYLDRSLLKSPETVYMAAANAWTKLQAKQPGWPNVGWLCERKSNKWVHDWSALPTTLHQDAQAWLDRLAGKDLFEDRPVRPVRPKTITAREWQIRAFATAVQHKGHAVDSLAALVDLETFKDGLRFLVDRNGQTGTVADIACAMKAIARHHCRLPEDEVQKLAQVIARIDHRKRQMTAKNRQRLRPLNDSKTAALLVGLPQLLAKKAAAEKRPFAAARLMETAVAIEILLMAPVRISNLVRIDLGKHLIWFGESLHLVIAPDEVKNRESLDFPFPDQTTTLISDFIQRYRPTLALPNSTALFPGRDGDCKAINSLRHRIVRTVKAEIGLDVSPHLFRHIAAKLFLDAHPGQYEVVRRLLGHRRIETTTAIYTGMETAAAVRHFDSVILSLRAKIVPPPEVPQ